MTTTNEPTEDVLRKIRKLLALAQSPNPNEAANAAAKARKLLLEHGLSMDELGQAPGEVKEEVWRRFPGARRNTMTGQLGICVAKANMCRLLGAIGGLTHAWILVGRPAAIEAAKLQLDFLYEAMERNVKAASAGRGMAWMNDYRLGWIFAVSRRLDDAAKSDTVEERGLILREDAAVVEYMDAAAYKRHDTKLRSADELDATAFARGHRDGEKVSLAKQLPGA